MFGGAFLDQKICRGCDHRFECEESFLSLSLPVKSKTLEESLKEFVKGDWLEGDNAYFCEKCNEKVRGGGGGGGGGRGRREKKGIGKRSITKGGNDCFGGGEKGGVG